MAKQVRSLGLLEATAIGLGTMIAAGIFSLSGLAVSEIGSSAVFSFVIAALIGGTTAAAYSEFASVYSESGGGYLFASRTFDNDYLVYIEGFMLFMGYSATTAFYLATMGEWFHEFIFAAPPWAPAVFVAVALGYLNARGTKESGTFQVIVTAAKVLVLLVFIGGAFLFQPPTKTVSTFMNSFSSDVVGILRIAALAFITFFGFSAIAANAGEIKKPRRTVPLSIAISMVTVTILYSFVIMAMVNSPVPAEVVAEQGETAMGSVAEAFLGPYGLWLIVAGAIFSMVSASNASILAASRIGYLMGQEGRMFSRFQYLSKEHGTPFWSIFACTGVIVSLIVVFVGIFPAHGEGFLGINLGLSALTGFANTNLLIPLSVVNIALIYSRRKFKDMDRPFKTPLVPLIPIIGVVANLGLLYNQPKLGLYVGVGFVIVSALIYALVGKDVEPTDDKIENLDHNLEVFPEDSKFRVLIPVARAEQVHSQLNILKSMYDDREKIHGHIMYVEETPEQTPSDSSDSEELERHISELQKEVDSYDLGDLEISVDGYKSQDIAEAILHLSHVNTTDLILMGYPERHRQVVKTVQDKAPCTVLSEFNVTGETDFSKINIGVGESVHHSEIVDSIANYSEDIEVHVTRVTPEVSGTPETLDETVNKFPEGKDIQIHTVKDRSVARGLVKKTEELDGVLFIGSSRDNWLKQTIFGSTPDRVVEISTEYNNVPVVILNSSEGVSSKIGNVLFTIKRTVWSLLH